MWASTLWPFSSSTRNIAFGSDSTIVPSSTMASSFGLARRDSSLTAGWTPCVFGGRVGGLGRPARTPAHRPTHYATGPRAVHQWPGRAVFAALRLCAARGDQAVTAAAGDLDAGALRAGPQVGSQAADGTADRAGRERADTGGGTRQLLEGDDLAGPPDERRQQDELQV